MPTTTNSRTILLDQPQRDWRCCNCFKLLGKRARDRIHLRITHCAEYWVSLPVTTVCRCGSLNELPRPLGR